MDGEQTVTEIIQLAGVGIDALLKVIGKLKASNGLSDDQIVDAAGLENDAAKQAIQSYLNGTA